MRLHNRWDNLDLSDLAEDGGVIHNGKACWSRSYAAIPKIVNNKSITFQKIY